MSLLALAGYVGFALICSVVLVSILVWVERFAAWLDTFWQEQA